MRGDEPPRNTCAELNHIGQGSVFSPPAANCERRVGIEAETSNFQENQLSRNGFVGVYP
jgi:hypothetical protein